MKQWLSVDLNSLVNNSIVSLLSKQWRLPDSGWGKSPWSRGSDVWSTAEILELLRDEPLFSKESYLQTLGFLASLQKEDGGWGVEETSDTTGTALTLIALARSRLSDFDNVIEKGLIWLYLHQNEDGGWPLHPLGERSSHQSTLFTTCFACITVLECNKQELVSAVQYNKMIPWAQSFLQTSRSKDGGWGLAKEGTSSDARHTAYAAYVLHHILRIHKGKDLSVRWLKTHQNHNGSWGETIGGDLESTAASLIALLSMGESPRSPDIRQGLGYVLSCYKQLDNLCGWAESLDGSIRTWTAYYAIWSIREYQQRLKEEERSTHISFWHRLWKFMVSPTSNAVLLPLFVSAIILLLLYIIPEGIPERYKNTLGFVGLLLTVSGAIWAGARRLVSK